MNSNRFLSKQYVSTYIVNSKNNNTCLRHPKKEIWKMFNQSINNKNTNGTMGYLAELTISGYIEKLINDTFNYYIDNINVTCPQLLLFIYHFYKYWNRIDSSIKKKHVLSLVNDQIIRNWLFFFTSMISTCSRNKFFKAPKIEQIDFDMKRHRETLVSKNLDIVHRFIIKDDPKDIIIPLSEICNYIYNTGLAIREQKILYWYSWIASYEKHIHKGTMVVGYRDIPGIDMKSKRDFVWIIWDILKYFSNENNKKLIYILFYLYTSNFSKSSKKSRSNILFFAIYIVTNPFPKIEYPLKPIDDAQFTLASINSLRSNTYIMKIFQQMVLTQANHV